MLDSLTRDISGTKVFLVGDTDGSMAPLASSLRSYNVDAELFRNSQSALEAGRPHVVAYVKAKGQDELESMQRHFHTARFVVIGTIESERELLSAFGRGIHGWVMHWEPLDTIVSAILLVCRGGASMSLPVLEVLQRRADISGEAGLALAGHRGLTGRQVEILDLVSRGHPDKEIADLLTLSTRTVQRHVQDILQKLDVHSREAAVRVVLGEAPPPARRLS